MSGYQLFINSNATGLYPVIAGNYWLRLKGWMFKPSVAADEALWIHPCNSIHTFFMRFSIDAVFVDVQGYAIACCSAVPARRLRAEWRASSVLELPAGAISALGIVSGDLIQLREVGNDY